MPDKLAHQIIAHGTALEGIVNCLSRVLRLPTVDFPTVQIRTWNAVEIEAAALACRQHWKLGVGPISNMCRVLENAGAVITYFDTDRDEVDALSMARNRPLVVRNKLKSSPGRQRFDLAHECGHLVIHAGIETGDKETESQANSFAAAFLMPRGSFGNEFPAMFSRIDWNAVYSLKIRWRVSAKAVIRRAKDLGLLDAVRYESANRHLNSSGQARNELYDDRIPSEEPELIANAINTYLSAKNIQLGDFAREVDMTPVLIEQLVPGLQAMLLRELHDEKFRSKGPGSLQ